MYKRIYIFLLLGFIYSGNCKIINSKVVRRINIESQLVKIKTVITLQNSGLSDVNNFIFTLDPGVQNFCVKFKNEKDTELIFEKIAIYSDGNQSRHDFQVFLNEYLPVNATYIVQVETVYIDQIVPLYKTLAFDQDQYALFKGNLFYYSPYKTLLLETAYNWKKSENLQFTHNPHNIHGNSFNYFHKDVAPYSYEETKLDFKNNNPFFVVTNLERIIDISHFGNICVEDRVTVKNKGSKLVGPYEHRLSSIEQLASGWWYTHLPAAAENVEFFDTIGNNSKSELLHFNKYTTLKFKPRYPLLGGWKTFYIIKYRTPTFEYLYHDLHGYFLLKMRAIDHILNDVIVSEVLVKVLLPEAAEIVEVNTPTGFTQLENEKRYTTLSTFGQPTIVLTGSNILENHIDYFTIKYLFYSSYLLRVPFILIFFLQGMFIFAIVLFRVEYM